MHTYEPKDGCGHDIGGFRFADAVDVVEWARRDRTIGWKTWPEVWHLEGDGTLRCYMRASSLASIRAWADDPLDLYRSRRHAQDERTCTSRWLIVESRPTWRHPEIVVDERDAKAFQELRGILSDIGVDLVDAMIFDDQCHWWSMQELTTGSTRW